MNAPRALIAEDEPLLAQALQAELARAWPGLEIAGVAGDGHSAVAEALRLGPDVLFFDIRMPGQSGLEAAAALADAWPAGQAFPVLVFVTAYDQYAVQAFDAQAVDYVLKPVQRDRLKKTVLRVQQALAARTRQPADIEASIEAAVAPLRTLLAATPPPTAGLPPPADAEPLRMIQASVGQGIRMVPLDEVLCFDAADKYLRVLTAGHEYLIRTPLKELLPRLDEARFWQIHRGTVVRADAIDSVLRDDAGRSSVSLRGLDERFAVSRLYAHRFRAM